MYQYAQSPSSFSGESVPSQYRGMQKTFQPTGYVSSAYGQNLNVSSFQGNQWGTSFVNPQSYHSANYRGNQPGHDNYLRADSTNPSQSGWSAGNVGNAGNVGVSAYGTGAAFGGQYQSQNQFSSPQSYHMANYRGNQPGHDNYLRADSTNPSQSGWNAGNVGNAGVTTYGMGTAFGGVQHQNQFVPSQYKGMSGTGFSASRSF